MYTVIVVIAILTGLAAPVAASTTYAPELQPAAPMCQVVGVTKMQPALGGTTFQDAGGTSEVGGGR